MNRGSLTRLAICSIVTGLAAFGLTVVTSTGMDGGYLFIFLGLLAQSTFLLWPDVTGAFARNQNAKKATQADDREPGRDLSR